MADEELTHILSIREAPTNHTLTDYIKVTAKHAAQIALLYEQSKCIYNRETRGSIPEMAQKSEEYHYLIAVIYGAPKTSTRYHVQSIHKLNSQEGLGDLVYRPAKHSTDGNAVYTIIDEEKPSDLALAWSNAVNARVAHWDALSILENAVNEAAPELAIEEMGEWVD
jgi:hypothetical protein